MVFGKLSHERKIVKSLPKLASLTSLTSLDKGVEMKNRLLHWQFVDDNDDEILLRAEWLHAVFEIAIERSFKTDPQTMFMLRINYPPIIQGDVKRFDDHWEAVEWADQWLAEVLTRVVITTNFKVDQAPPPDQT